MSRVPRAQRVSFTTLHRTMNLCHPWKFLDLYEHEKTGSHSRFRVLSEDEVGEYREALDSVAGARQSEDDLTTCTCVIRGPTGLRVMRGAGCGREFDWAGYRDRWESRLL